MPDGRSRSSRMRRRVRSRGPVPVQRGRVASCGPSQRLDGRCERRSRTCVIADHVGAPRAVAVHVIAVPAVRPVARRRDRRKTSIWAAHCRRVAARPSWIGPPRAGGSAFPGPMDPRLVDPAASRPAPGRVRPSPGAIGAGAPGPSGTRGEPSRSTPGRCGANLPSRPSSLTPAIPERIQAGGPMAGRPFDAPWAKSASGVRPRSRNRAQARSERDPAGDSGPALVRVRSLSARLPRHRGGASSGARPVMAGACPKPFVQAGAERARLPPIRPRVG